MKKHGFTLIELLAVIVILAIIALISVPIILGVVEDSKKKSYESSLSFLLDATNYYLMKNETIDMKNDGLDVTDDMLVMNNKMFIKGKVYLNDNGQLELDKVTDGTFCGSGTRDNFIVVKGNCEYSDLTTIKFDAYIGLVTSDSIKVIITKLEDIHSGIKKIEYSIDNGATFVEGIKEENTYVFSDLKENQKYNIIVKVTNNINKTVQKNFEVLTSNVTLPIFSVDKEGWQKSKTVTINYPTGTNFAYQYSIDSGKNWLLATQNQTVTFNTNSTLIARVMDKNTVLVVAPISVNKIDNNKPVLTIPNNSVAILNETFDYMKDVTCVDNENSCTIVKTGEVDTTKEGEYTITYKGTDEVGNVTTVDRKIRVIKPEVFDFSYNGTYHTYTVNKTGTYKLETWGAQGGDASSTLIGGRGGYSSAVVTLQKDQIVYIYIGGKGNASNKDSEQIIGGYNGGGRGFGSASSGGGATHMATENGLLSTLSAKTSTILLVAGGGGGSVYYSVVLGVADGMGGAGGGLIADAGKQSGSWASRTAQGGTQTSGGLYGMYSNIKCGETGTFGQGGDGHKDTTGECPANYVAGGGAGYFGGGSGRHVGGGGGSGYATPEATNVILKRGSEYIPSALDNTTILGNSGNGFAKITPLTY